LKENIFNCKWMEWITII